MAIQAVRLLAVRRHLSILVVAAAASAGSCGYGPDPGGSFDPGDATEDPDGWHRDADDDQASADATETDATETDANADADPGDTSGTDAVLDSVDDALEVGDALDTTPGDADASDADPGDAGPGDAGPDTPADCSLSVVARSYPDAVALWGRDGLLGDGAFVPVDFDGVPCPSVRVFSSTTGIRGVVEPTGVRLAVDGGLIGLHHAELAVVSTADDRLLAAFDVTARLFPTADPSATPKALFVGIDGMRSDAFYAADTPVLDGLASIGAWTLDGRTHLGTTDSSVGWTTLYTSVGPERHGVTNNGDTASRDWSYRSFSEVARADGGLRTAMAGHWATAVTTLHEATAFDDTRIGTDAEVAATISGWLQSADHDALATQFDDVDHAGHGTGFSPANPDYIEAIEVTDAHVGTMIDALLQRETLADERWLIVVATDHGGEGTSHGAINLPNQRIPFIFSGSIPLRGAFESTVEQFDVAPTILAHLGLSPLPPDRTDGIARLGEGEAVDAGATRPEFEAVCDDRIDQDGDGAIDCADLDCDAATPCSAVCVDGSIGSLVGSDVARGSSAGEDTDYSITCSRLPAGIDVARSWVAPTTGRYTFTTVGSDYDTVMAVYRGDCPRPRDQLACNDDTSGLLSSVTVDVAAGATYAIVISGFDGETGNWRLNIEPAP